MAGILDLFSNPANQGVLNLSAGLLNAAGPQMRPVSFGQALGQGAQQGMQAYQAAQQAQAQQQLLALQMQEAQRRATQPIAAGPGTQLFRPGEMSPFATVPFKPEATPQILPQSPLGKLAYDLKSGSISQQQFDEQFKKLTAPAQPVVTVDNRQESAFAKKVGGELGDQYAGLLKADMNAPSTIAKYQRLGSLLGQVNTGKFKGATTDIKAAAKGLGIDLNALGVTDDVAPAQAARALSNQMALELRNPAGGAGMPGAMSDSDRTFLLQSVPGLENDPNAIGKMIEYRTKLAQREQQVARKAREYRKAHNGVFDEGFFNELADWSAKNPLFPEAEKSAPAGGFSIRKLP